MTEEKINNTKHQKQLDAIIITFVVLTLAVFFGIQLIMKTGVFQKPGQLTFESSMTELTRDFVNTTLDPIEHLHLSADVSVSDLQTYDFPIDPLIGLDADGTSYSQQSLVYDILVPVTTFDDPTTNISSSDIDHYNLVSVHNLTPEQKALSIDNHYYLDNLDAYPSNVNQILIKDSNSPNSKYGRRGAVFECLIIYGESSDVRKVAEALVANIAEFPKKSDILSLAQTGVTALSRRMNTKLAQVNNNGKYFSEKIGPFLSQFDFTHTSNEASFSTSANGTNICSQPAMIDTLTGIGLDIVELTGNHNLDCGAEDAINTIKKYQELGIKTVGGGISATEAAIPLEIDAKSTNITILAYNLSTGGYTTNDQPGANLYTEEKAKADIAAAQERGDFIIVDVQYYECNEYANTSEDTTCDYADSSSGDQVTLFRSLIDMGTDIVVGTAAHQPQTYEQYHNGFIYYGLGNLFFDQSAWPGTTRSLILVHYFRDNRLLQTRIVPTIYDDNFQTTLMPNNQAVAFLQRLLNAQPKAANGS